MQERAAGLVAAAVTALGLTGCRPEIASRAAPATTTPAAAMPSPGRPAPSVESVRPWANPTRPTPTARDRNPFKFDTDGPHNQPAPIAPGVSPNSLPELPLPVPASDLRLIGIAGAEHSDGGFTAIVTVGNDLVFARAGDTIAARYRVVAVGEDSVDVIDAVGNQPRHFSIR